VWISCLRTSKQVEVENESPGDLYHRTQVQLVQDEMHDVDGEDRGTYRVAISGRSRWQMKPLD